MHEISKPDFWEKKRKNISICHLQKIIPRMLSIKVYQTLNLFMINHLIKKSVSTQIPINFPTKQTAESDKKKTLISYR